MFRAIETVLLFSFVLAASGYIVEPKFPKLLDASSPAHTRIHITSERFHHDGVFTQAEEFVDLELGKAAYIETTNNVRTSWLVDFKESFVYKYWPFKCQRFAHQSIDVESSGHFPYVVFFDGAWSRIPLVGNPGGGGGGGGMLVFGISALMEWFQAPTNVKKYEKLAGVHSSAATHNLTSASSERVAHRWSESTYNQMQATFMESSDELELSSITYKGLVTVNILSIERNFPPHAYHNELQMPLIYGCRREGKLGAEMQTRFDQLAAQVDTRHHLKTQAKAIDFAGHQQIASEQSTIEFALSQPRDASFDSSPVRVHMTYFQRGPGSPMIKTVVDRRHNIMYEARPAARTCTISNLGPMKAADESTDATLVFEFSNGLQLRLNTQQLSSILHELTSESFMKLEQRGDVEYAYFSVSKSDMFAKRLARVVRRFAFYSDGQVHLDSLAIWIFESPEHDSKIAEVYDFKVVESRPLDRDTNSAHAFDVSQECFINNREMSYGKDFAWVELEYSQQLSTEQLELIKFKVDELKDAFYRSIRTNININYLRIPKMEIFFTEAGFLVRLLLLDSPPAHLVYEEFKNLALSPALTAKEQHVSNLSECSKFCRKQSCFVMTFNRQDLKCGLAVNPLDSNQLIKSEFADTYKISAQCKPQLPKDALRLERQVQFLETTSSNHSGILGFHELGHQDSTKRMKSLADLRVVLRLNNKLVDLFPTNARALTEEQVKAERAEADLVANASTLDMPEW